MKRLIALALAPLAAYSIEVDGVAARVGTDAILRSDVLMEMQRARADESRYAEIRNEMIDRKLILKAAGESKMTMQEWVVESRVREIIDKAFGGDRNKLLDTLARQKVSYPEWYARMKEDMIVSAMRWQVIDKNVTASPAEMRRRYDDNPGAYSTDHRVTVSVILLKPEDSSKRDAISSALKDKPFAEIAKAHSADARAADGGVWKDVVPEDTFKPEVCEEIAKMPKGTISHWIEIDGWSFLLRKDDENDGRKLSFEEAYDRIEADVKEEKAKAAYIAWMKRLRSETYVKVY